MAYEEYATAEKCLGRCLYQLAQIGIPLRIVSDVCFDGESSEPSLLNYAGRAFATVSWVATGEPMFEFTERVYQCLQTSWLVERYVEMKGVADQASAENADMFKFFGEGNTHVDTFIDKFYHDDQTHNYASWVLFLHRLAAVYQIKWAEQLALFKLFCTYEGKRYRVTGASRLGDIWLAEDFSRKSGYNHRVSVNQCSDFSATP